MYKKVEQSLIDSSLQVQDECPKCSVDWVGLQRVLEEEPLGSYQLDQALIIIMNCPVCKMRFKPLMETCRKVYNARHLDRVGIEFEKV